MSYIVEDATKIISSLCKLDQQTKSRFQTKLGLEYSFFVQKAQGSFFLKRTMSKDFVIVIVICVIDLTVQ